MIRIGIIGATAYTSYELIKILLRHPETKITYLGIRRADRPNISDIFPALNGLIDLKCEPIDPNLIPENIDLAFITLPPTISMQYVPLFLKKGKKVVDFSADYRFQDVSLYEKWYKTQHTDSKGLEKAVYGLPELFRDSIKKSPLVGNPGCYTTASILAIAPLLLNDIIDPEEIIIDAKSGVSGRGREPKEGTHYCECNESIEAYSIDGHRHCPEIEHVMSLKANKTVAVQFLPHLIPMNRGILCSVYTRLQKETNVSELDGKDILTLYKKFFRNEPFIRIKENNKLPKTKDVTSTNFCDLYVKTTHDRIIILSAIDNLIKGASGQAVQNMNIMYGFDEETGLKYW